MYGAKELFGKKKSFLRMRRKRIVPYVQVKGSLIRAMIGPRPDICNAMGVAIDLILAWHIGE